MAPEDLGTSATLAADVPSARDVSEPPAKLADRYELLGLLGVGGMGAVYRARDIELGEMVALKMLRVEFADDAPMLARFRAEVRLARKVTHPNVARTYDIGEHGRVKFLTMELIDGRSLAAALSERSLPLDEAIEIGCAVCAGMSAAHAAGVVHRDLKPDNILIAKDGRVVVTDFGIAGQQLPERAGKHSGIIGTPAYMAPEQLESSAIDHRADVYALGAVLFEMFTGERAWPGESLMELISARLKGSVPDPKRIRPDLPDEIASIVTRCMAVRPLDRFSSVSEVGAELRGAPITRAEAPPAPIRAPHFTAKDMTLAVLPLRNLGPAEDAYLAQGVTEDLTDTLSMTPHLRVRPPNAVSRTGRTDEIGHALGVQVVVDGSLQRVGETVRFSARLISTTDGFQIWARRFQAPMNDLLVLCDEAAKAIAEALTTELRLVERQAPTNPAAIELYLRGKHELRRLWASSAASVAELFEKALVLAPEDPRIITSCAIARTRMLFFGEGDRPIVAARALQMAELAIKVAPDFGDAWAALALLRLNVGDVVGCARALGEGSRRAPNAALLQDAVGRLLLEVGSAEEAILRLDVALELDPTNLMTRCELARGLALVGSWKRSDEILAEMEPSVPRDIMSVRTALWRRAPFDGVDAPKDSYTRVYHEALAGGVLRDDHRTFMRQRLVGCDGRMRLMFLQRNVELYSFANDLAAAREDLEEAVRSGLIDLLWIDRCPILTSLRTDSEWARIRSAVEARAAEIMSAFQGSTAR